MTTGFVNVARMAKAKVGLAVLGFNFESNAIQRSVTAKFWMDSPMIFQKFMVT
jgi:hypothetical protein